MRRISIFEGFMINFWDGLYTVHLFLELYDFFLEFLIVGFITLKLNFTICSRGVSDGSFT